MDKKDFMAQYRSKWWMETSKRIKSRDHNTCQMCGCNDKPLSVHHLCYGENGSLKVEDDSLITLCDECHESQKYYREGCNELLGDIRSKLTDFEIYHILQYVYGSFLPVEGVPIWMRSKIDDIEIPKDYADKEEEQMLENLKNWRKPIYAKTLIHDAIFEYYVHSIKAYGGQNDIKAWFLDNFGVTIDNYIENHKEYASNIEVEVRQHLEKLKKNEK